MKGGEKENMAKYIGRRIDLGIGRESSRGAGVAPSFWVPKVEFSFDDKVIKAREIGGMGSIEDAQDAYVTTKYGQGNLSGELGDRHFGLMLYAMLGTLSTAGPTDSAYTHSVSLAQSNQHQSLAFVVKDPNTSEIYKLVMLNSLELNVALDQIVMYNAEFIGKQGNAYTTPTASYTVENKFTKKHLSFKVASDLSGLDAATAISLKSLRLTISKNVVLDDVLGTVEPEDILNQQISVEGEITLNYEDETWKNYVKDNTKRAIEIKLTNTDATIGASTNPSLTIRVPYADWFEWAPNNAGDEIVTQTLSFKANKDVSGGNALISTCSLVNNVTSY